MENLITEIQEVRKKLREYKEKMEELKIQYRT